MSRAVKDLLESFDHPSEDDQYAVVSEILRRATKRDLDSLTDNELILNTESVFLSLEARESGNGNSCSMRSVACGSWDDR